MNSVEIRQKFLKFFEERGHTPVSSSSLATEDPSVLFTTAGMQQFKPYYIGAKDPMVDFGSKNTTSSQKCVRTSDIEEVGDERHLTFFEMLGNFSFGGYWKEEAIKLAHEFVTKEMGLKIDYVTVFEGEAGVPADVESENIWKSIDSTIDVRRFGRADNFWGPTGEEGPCGPTTEIYVNGIEIWNIVFNEFYQSKDKTLRPLDIKGIDTGMGLERLAMVVQKVETVFDTDLFTPITEKISKIYGVRDKKIERIISDHVRSAVFMISDGVVPSNTEKGYILRRLLRRAIFQAYKLAPGYSNLYPLVDVVIDRYKDSYKDLDSKRKMIHSVFEQEESKFMKTLDQGTKELDKKTKHYVLTADTGTFNIIPGKVAFDLFQSHGFPLELTQEISIQKGMSVDMEAAKEELKKHQELSRTGAEQKFKGGLAGHSEIEIRYHTATHLLHQALRNVLGPEVSQKGSNITTERLRFDFAFPRKLTDEEKAKVEAEVNEKIKASLPMQKVILPKAEAEQTGALHFFGDKYGDEVSIYYIGENIENAYSKEFCGGPHVSNTKELGVFKIQKEEAVSLGVRRIKALLQ